MNLIDFLVVLIFLGFAVFSMYHGFLHSVLKAAADLISWIAALILHPILAWITGSRAVIGLLTSYTEGSLKLAESSSMSRLVADVPREELISMVHSSSLVTPFSTLARKNLLSESFAGRGLQTVGQYCDETVAQASLNILCLLLLFVVIRLVIGLYINVVDYQRPLPVLVQYEIPFAAVAGLLRGIICCYVLFILMPIVLSVFDVKMIVEYINSSFLGTVFYKTNLALLLIGGR